MSWAGLTARLATRMSPIRCRVGIGGRPDAGGITEVGIARAGTAAGRGVAEGPGVVVRPGKLGRSDPTGRPGEVDDIGGATWASASASATAAIALPVNESGGPAAMDGRASAADDRPIDDGGGAVPLLGPLPVTGMRAGEVDGCDGTPVTGGRGGMSQVGMHTACTGSEPGCAAGALGAGDGSALVFGADEA